MGLLRDAWAIYRENALKIFLLCTIIVFPIQGAYLFLSDFFYGYFWYQDAVFLGHLLHALFILIVLSVVQLPFMQIALQKIRGEKTGLGQAFECFFQHAFPVYLISLVYVLLVLAGYIVLVIPGLIAMVLFFLFPYALVMEGKKGLQSLARAFQLGASRFFPLCGMMLGLGMMEWGLSVAVSFVTVQLADGGKVDLLLQGLFTLFFLPFFVFVVTIKYAEWSAHEEGELSITRHFEQEQGW